MTTFEERKAIRKSQYGTKPAHCVACSGTGYYDSAGSPRCSVCNGTGKDQTQRVVSMDIAPQESDNRLPSYRDRPCVSRP